MARRTELASAGVAVLEGIIDDLFAGIAEVAPNAIRRDSHSIELGRGRLQFDLNLARGPIDEGAFEHWKWDVVAGGRAAVRQSVPEYEWRASLWYARPPGEEGYRWWEVAYCTFALNSQRARFEPFALAPGSATTQTSPALASRTL